MPGPFVHLIYGSDAVRVHQERARLVGEILPPGHRAENLTEIEAPAGRMLSLNRIAADLMGELATPSFFPEVPRVVVVEQLAELFGSRKQAGATTAGGSEGKKGKTRKKKSTAKDAVAALCRFLERDLPETGNTLILTAVEEPDKWKRVSTSTKLFRTVQTIGRVSQYKVPPAVFAMVDAFSARDLPAALRSLSEVLERDDGVASVFRLLTRQVRFLIQAKLLERCARNGEPGDDFASTHFPPEKGLNLMMEHSFVIDKTRRMASRWTLAELNALLAKLERLTRVVYPSLNDTYVPDPEMQLEVLFIEACGKPR